VRVLYLELETRVGTIMTSAALEYEVIEWGEMGYPTEAAAEARSREIANDGFFHTLYEGRKEFVPAHFVQRVEVYSIPD
jgi:hypothetical protein